MKSVNSRLMRVCVVLSYCAGICIFSISVLSFAGWLFDLAAFRTLLPGFVPMTPNTAVCFILLSISLGSLSVRKPAGTYVRGVCSWTVVAIGSLTFVEYSTGLQFGIDTVMFRDLVQASMGQYPGRMSPLSAISFFLTGLGFAMFRIRNRTVAGLVEILFLASGLLGLLTVIGYLFATPGLYSVYPFKPMALHTAANFMLICAAAFFQRIDSDLMTMLTSNSEGGIMARRMLPVVIGIPIMLGWFVLSGERWNMYDLSLGVSLLTILIIVVFTFLIWENARSLHMMDLKRMEVEKVLRENEDKYRVIFETTGTATAIFEEDTTISLVNTEFEQLSGYTKAEIEGKLDYFNFVATREDRKRMQEYHRLRRIDSGKAPRNYEFKFIDRAGCVKDIFMTIALIPNTMRSIASLQDITERKRVEQMKSDFVSLVSHQLKTPVAQIKGYLYNMLVGLTGELTAKQREYLEDMQDISNKNYRLLSDLLNVSRIERGVIAVDIRSVPLKEIVDEAASPFYEQIKAKGLQLMIDGLEHEIVVMADKEKMIEGVGNAIHNALKFTEQGSISVRVSSKDTMAVVAVIDTGKGIPQDRLDRIFTRDMALDGAPTAGGGAGLGLYIAKQFMKLQKGDIAVQSIPGKGTSFIFSIPLAQG